MTRSSERCSSNSRESRFTIHDSRFTIHDPMLILELYVFVLAGFVGFMVIQRVPPLLHTPLMAATHMVSGISLVGSLIAAGSAHNRVATVLGFVAVVFATSNIVGGYLIT